MMKTRRPNGRVRVRTALGVAAVCSSAALWALVPPGSQADPQQGCETRGSIFVNTATSDTGDPTLYEVSPRNASILEQWKLSRSYTDIAFGSDGETLYGIEPVASDLTLYKLDSATKQEQLLGTIKLPESYYANALTARPDGTLLTGAARSRAIYSINPSDLTARKEPVELPEGHVSGGDFLTLPDGDVLAVTTFGDGMTGLVRIKTDKDGKLTEAVPVGHIPGQSFGAGLTGGWLYLARPDGTIHGLEVASLPTKRVEPAQLANSAHRVDTTVLDLPLGTMWGATSRQDASLCPNLRTSKTADPGTETHVKPGETITYTLSFSNQGGQIPADVAFTEEIGDVLDDAVLVGEPVISEERLLSLTTSGSKIQVKGVLPVDATATVKLTVKVADVPTGNRALVNHLVPTGEDVPSTCTEGSAMCTTHEVSTAEPTPTGSDKPTVGLPRTGC